MGLLNHHVFIYVVEGYGVSSKLTFREADDHTVLSPFADQCLLWQHTDLELFAASGKLGFDRGEVACMS